MGKYLDSIGLASLIGKIKTALGLKQDTLVSGTNIKTVNNQSLLGSGNIAISGGSSLPSGGAANDVLAKNSSTEGDLKWLTLGEVASLDSSDFGALAWEDSLTYSDVGAAASSHTHSYLPLSGGTLTGHLVMNAKYVYLDSSNIDIDTPPSSGTSGDSRITARDKNDKAVAQLIPYIGSNGRYGWQFGTTNNWAYITTDGTNPHVAFTNAAVWRTGLGLGTAATHAHGDYAPSGDYWEGSKGDTSYWGFVNPDGSPSGWMRTTTSGLLPAAAGGGSSSLGTSTWPFTNLYATNIYHNGTKLGTAATHADTDYADATHSHSEYFSDQVNRTANTVLAAPNGSTGHASFRKLVAADIPYTTLYGYYAASSATQVNVANTSLYRFLVILFRTNSATYTGGGTSAATSPLNSTVVHINKKSSGSVYVSLMGAHALSASSVQIRTGLATVTCSATAGKVTLSNQRYINLGNGSSGTQEVGTQTDMALVGVIGIY